MKSIVIWQKPNGEIYYRIVGSNDYRVGDYNGYNHKILFVISHLYEYEPKIPIRNRVIRNFISFLHKFEK